MNQPKVGIIYLTFATPNWCQDIPRAMKSLEEIVYPPEQIELICVESNSPSGEIVKPWFEQEWMPKSGKELPRIHYIFHDEKIGFAGNVNHGFARAKELGCDYVYLLNEDAEVHPDFLRYAVERAEQDPKIAYVQSLILLGQDKNKVNTVGNAYHYLGFGYSNGYLWTHDQANQFFEQERKTHLDLEIGYASGAGVLGRVSLIDQCGLFDEKFFAYHEDTDATFQARIRGYKIVIEPLSIIYHYYEFTKTQMPKNFLVERNRWVILLSYYRLWTFLLIVPMLFVMEVGQLIFSIWGGWWREKIKVYREIVSSEFWQWIKVRHEKIQRERVISDRELLRYAVSTIEFQGEAVANPLLQFIGNPLMKVYWGIVKRLI
ncbi:glycosyltransferase family 2 protein [Candidatus Uhrbacteria bacterium]|nr:glycosyltransferase family 2 protein [Candidatus Uhrbacteria bacterium]